MRPSTKDLLDVRDGKPVDATLMSDITTDPTVQQELNRLRDVQVALRNLPDFTPPADVWDRIQAEAAQPAPAAEPSSEWGRWLGTLAVAAGVALVAVMVISPTPPASLDEGLGETTPQTAQINDDQADLREGLMTPRLASLVNESRRLERVVAGFGEGPRIVNAATAGTIVEVQDQILWIDDRLSRAAVDNLSPQQVEALWTERVRLMNSLAALRYAQSQRFAF